MRQLTLLALHSLRGALRAGVEAGESTDVAACNASSVIPALVTASAVSSAACELGLLRQARDVSAPADRLRMAAAQPVKSGVQAVPALRDLGVVPTDITLGTASSSREQVLQFIQALEDCDIPGECQVPEVEVLRVAHPADAISHVEHLRRCDSLRLPRVPLLHGHLALCQLAAGAHCVPWDYLRRNTLPCTWQCVASAHAPRGHTRSCVPHFSRSLPTAPHAARDHAGSSQSVPRKRTLTAAGTLPTLTRRALQRLQNQLP
jgi:hypothetical protein